MRRRKKTVPKLPTARTDYPADTFVSTENGVFLIKNGTRIEVPSKQVLDSWRVDIVPSTEAAVKHLKVFGKLGFRNGTVVQDFTDGKTYVISANQRRLLLSPEALRKYTRTAIMVVSHIDILRHREGEPLE